ncbi:MAG TPA: class I SAM-dependent methyltransferase [Candidatus Binataceae bacterium]|nr:class I SAM-dependent methyltransferase [Candidatus Binataceae bacterium]
MISHGGLFRELTDGLPRQGPGSTTATLRALGLIRDMPVRPRILDVGCGPGAQTIDLARATGGEIVAVDLRERFLKELRARAEAAGVTRQIETRKQSMFEMDFPEESFDLIWSEGAIYIRGFADGLRAWRRFLRPNGWIVVSELTWLIADPPAAARKYWAEHYPRMQALEQNRRIAMDAGYEELRTFALPVQDWWNNYYGPGQARLLEVRARHADDPRTIVLLDDIRREYDLFRTHSDSYGYVFYVMRKPAK